ncbi:MAG: class III signal peptide-containing protein [Candidatus Diapherotrites archaeon]
MNSKGQGALEYLLLIGGAVLVAVVVIVLILGLGKSTGGEVNDIVQTGITNMEAAAGTGGTGGELVTNPPIGTYPPEFSSCDPALNPDHDCDADSMCTNPDFPKCDLGTCKCVSEANIVETPDPSDGFTGIGG